jgi:hypothetical protein
MKSKMRDENEFDRLLVRTIDNSLRELLTEDAATIIYAYLKNEYALDQEEIPGKLDTFDDGLRDFLSSGASTVERVILENLCSNLQLECRPRKEKDFKNSIVQLKSCLKLR